MRFLPSPVPLSIQRTRSSPCPTPVTSVRYSCRAARLARLLGRTFRRCKAQRGQLGLRGQPAQQAPASLGLPGQQGPRVLPEPLDPQVQRGRPGLRGQRVPRLVLLGQQDQLATLGRLGLRVILGRLAPLVRRATLGRQDQRAIPLLNLDRLARPDPPARKAAALATRAPWPQRPCCHPSATLSATPTSHWIPSTCGYGTAWRGPTPVPSPLLAPPGLRVQRVTLDLQGPRAILGQQGLRATLGRLGLRATLDRLGLRATLGQLGLQAILGQLGLRATLGQLGQLGLQGLRATLDRLGRQVQRAPPEPLGQQGRQARRALRPACSPIRRTPQRRADTPVTATSCGTTPLRLRLRN